MMSERLLAQAHEEATHVLSGRFGAVRLGPPTLLKDTTRTVVGRAAVLDELPGVASVVIKVIRDDVATGCTEWAALVFLSARPTLRGVVPAWLGGALASPPLFVMEDLGLGRTCGGGVSRDQAHAPRARGARPGPRGRSLACADGAAP